MLANPVAMSVIAADGGFVDRRAGAENYEIFDLGRVSPPEFTLITLVFAAGYLALAGLFLTGAASRIAHESGRRR